MTKTSPPAGAACGRACFIAERLRFFPRESQEQGERGEKGRQQLHAERDGHRRRGERHRKSAVAQCAQKRRSPARGNQRGGQGKDGGRQREQRRLQKFRKGERAASNAAPAREIVMPRDCRVRSAERPFAESSTL